MELQLRNINAYTQEDSLHALALVFLEVPASSGGGDGAGGVSALAGWPCCRGSGGQSLLTSMRPDQGLHCFLSLYGGAGREAPGPEVPAPAQEADPG